MQAEAPCPFSFTGQLQVAGMLSVIRNEGWALRSEFKGELEGLARSVAECGAILKIVDNTVVSFLVAGKSVLIYWQLPQAKEVYNLPSLLSV
nr:hypothetical protein [Pseudomonas sp. BIGb0427]